jgi:hypothetical protein
VTLFFYGLWMLCGVSCVVFAADAALARANVAALLAGFAAGALLVRAGRAPDVTIVAGGVLIVALWRLAKPGPIARVSSAAAAGIVAAFWAALFQAQGLPLALALPLAAIAPAVSAAMRSRHAEFAPDELHDEALLLLLVLAAILAVAPGVAAGWQSATALNLADKRVAAPVPPEWTVLMLLCSASLGGAYSLWTRR